MSDIVFSKYHDTEIAKADDFRFTASAPVDIISAILDGAFDEVVNSFVVSGMAVTQLASPTMNVQLAPGLAFSRAENKLLHLYSAVSSLVNPAHSTLDRLDTVEARYLSTDFNTETRAFKSPETGAITYNLVNTKTKVFVELKCVEGVAGSGVAPDAEAGWMKLAEVEVLAGATQIIDENIRGITAEEDGDANSAWTAETTAAFHLGSIESIKNTLYSHIRNNITSLNTVHGIRQGAGNGLDSDLLDGEHGSFYRNTANLDSGEYKITRSLIPGTDQYQLNILRADYDQAVVKVGPKSDWPDEDYLSYPKEATLTLYASRVRWYDLYVDISLNRLGDPDYPKFVTFMRGDGIRVPEWMVQYRKDSGDYTDLLSCDPEGDGRFYSHRGSVSCKLSEIGTITGLSAVNSSGDYYVDGSVSGLPVAESGVIHHSQNPYSTDNAFQEYKSLVNRTNHYLRAKVSGTWSDWNKIWNSANDGTGSGLDTDLFHGLNTDSFLIDGFPTVTAATIDEATTAGIYPYAHDGVTDTLLVFGTKVGGSTATVQIRYPYNGGPTWRNKTDSTTWTSWRNLWDSASDGSGSNLDADLLDGQHGSYYRDADTLDGQHGAFYQNAGNLNDGEIPLARIPATLTGKDADTLDGHHSSEFATSSQGEKADAAQPASTAINTGNIASQSVNYANSAGVSFGLSGYVHGTLNGAQIVEGIGASLATGQSMKMIGSLTGLLSVVCRASRQTTDGEDSITFYGVTLAPATATETYYTVKTSHGNMHISVAW